MSDAPIGRSLGRLTAAKAVANTALRWIPPFLPTLERAFGATTTQLTTILGIGEIGGLSTLAVATRLDRAGERRVMMVALGLVTASSLLALVGTTAAFAVSFFVLVVGVANLTVAGQAWLSHRVAYDRRARALGLYETSWALALLVGAPIVAVLINVFGWRGPFVALAIASAVSIAVVSGPLRPDTRTADPIGTTGRAASADPAQITLDAWATMIASGLTAMAGLSLFVVSGSWLDDAFGVSTGGIGALAVVFGGVELISSLTSAAVADRVGKLRSTLAGLVLLGIGLVVIVAADERLGVGFVGLVAFLTGFEFAFVTSLSLVSEAMPDARGRTLAVSNAVGTVARAVGVVAGGWLYGRIGIGATVTLSGTAAAIAVLLLVVSGRGRRTRRRTP